MSNVAQPSRDLKRVARYLNDCIEACIDGQKTYALAAAAVRSQSFKILLQQHSDQRAELVLSLQATLTKLGISPENEGSFGGMARRRMMEARHAVERAHDDFRILRACVNDESIALRIYDDARLALEEGSPVDVRVLLIEQQACIRGALEALRERLASH